MTQIAYRRMGNSYIPFDNSSAAVSDKLPPGVYTIKHDQMMGYYYSKFADSFEMPPKLYGAINWQSQYILNSYRERASRGKQTGVLLCGRKGSGKSLLARKIANESGLPVILVQDTYVDAEFKAKLTALQEAIIIFDEFEKKYSAKDANELLDFFDGAFQHRLLNIVISNQKLHQVYFYLLNRPSRLYYKLVYDKLDSRLVEEYLKENLVNKEKYKESILTYAAYTYELSFDELQALVEEVNRTNADFDQITSILNIHSPIRFGDNAVYDVRILLRGQDVTKDCPKSVVNAFAQNGVAITNDNYNNTFVYYTQEDTEGYEHWQATARHILGEDARPFKNDGEFLPVKVVDIRRRNNVTEYFFEEDLVVQLRLLPTRGYTFRHENF